MVYPVCTISSILSPAHYSVLSNDKDHVSEVMELEERMRTEMLNEDTSDVNLSRDMCVAVVSPDGTYKRGVVKKKVAESLYEVLLLDYGEIVQAERIYISVITNPNFMETEPLAFLVRLYGLIPVKFITYYERKKAKATQGWSQESMMFVRDLFKRKTNVVVQNILIKQRTVYGDIFIQTESQAKLISLRKLLCTHEFCVFSETNFLRLEGLENSKELETKMEWVEKWQKESFGIKSGSLYFTDTKSDIQSQKEECERESTSEGSLELRRIDGAGRGKIKNMISQFKKQEMPSSDENKRENSNFPGTNRPLGRGHILKGFGRVKSSPKSTPDVAPERHSSLGAALESFLDADNSCMQNPSSKVERAVIKREECSELNDSIELAEASFSTDEEPPSLVRNLKLEEQLESTALKDVQDISKESVCDKNTKLEDTTKMTSEILSPIETQSKYDSVRTLPKDNLKSRGGNWTEKIWERPPNQISLSSTLTPYVVFDDSVVEPSNSFAELPIKPSIIKNLEKGGTFKFLSQVQRWAIPAIRKQLNTIIIGSSKTGKTLSYVVPIIDYIQDECYFEELSPGNGPSVVIVASSSSVCESIYHLCCSLLGYYSKSEYSKSTIKIVLAHGGGCEKEVWVSLTNGCDILISTPHCLVRLLEMPILTNLERLTCLVFDEIDIISQNPFRKNVRVILSKAEYSAKSRNYQRILCGEKWTGNVESLAKTYVTPYALVIGSYSEAVVYEGIKPSIYLVERKKKPEVLLNKLNDLIGDSKILVVCEETSEAIDINNFLVENKIQTFLAHEDLMADILKDRGVTWKCSKDSALIVTDAVLNEMNVREAQILIHYELPRKSKTNFYLRYLSLESFRRDKQSFSKTQDKNPKNKIQNIIFIDDENHFQLPHIVDFVIRLKGKVSAKIMDKCHEIRRQIEVQKSDSAICENLLAFGWCRNWKNCPKRHALVNALDSPGSLPSSGWVNFSIIRIHDASWFSVRLISHTDVLGNKSKIQDRYLELPLKLSEFYKNESYLRPLRMPKVGDVCAVKTQVFEQDVFYRAKVMEYLKVDKYENPLEVSVKLMDRGDIWQRKNIELYELPESLSEYPPAAVDVRLTNLQPLDFDVSWSEVASSFIQNLMTQKLKDNQYWCGKIVLALNNTLFLGLIKRKQFLPQLNLHVFDMTVHDELLNNQFAVPNGDHLPALLKLCSEAGIKVADDKEVVKEDTAVIQPQWAFLDGDFIEVKFLAAENTSRVFLQPRKLEKVLQEVEEDCQKEGAKTLNEIKGKKRSAQSVTIGMFCLALFEDGKWNRGRIEEENEKEFYVFFIDHGDFLYISKANVVPISQTLLLRLPCQAIECNLVGVKEKEECPMKVLQEIYAFSEDGREYLYACVVKKDLEPSITKGRKYSLNLINKKGISLNKMLVELKMVCAEESELEHLKDIEMNESEEEEDEGEEEEQEEEEKKEEVKKEKEDIEAIFPENYFNTFTDKVFEDEGAQEFLKEFASKVFNVPRSSEKEKEEKPRLPLPPPPTSPPTMSNSPAKTYQSERLHILKQSYRKLPKELELKSREKVLTPQVLWCQNQVEVQLRIVLGNVTDCTLECGVNNISFRCLLEEKFYAMDLRLYGAINPEATRVTVKAFHVLVVLTKLTFPLWPRLHADDGKLRWIKLDVESLAEKDCVFAEKIRSVKQNIECGIIKKGIENETVQPCSDSEDSKEYEMESESSESEN